MKNKRKRNIRPFDVKKLAAIDDKRFRDDEAKRLAVIAVNRDRAEVAIGKSPVTESVHTDWYVHLAKEVAAALALEEKAARDKGEVWTSQFRQSRHDELRNKLNGSMWSSDECRRFRDKRREFHTTRISGIFDPAKGWTQELEEAQWKHHLKQMRANLVACMGCHQDLLESRRERMEELLSATFEEKVTHIYVMNFNADFPNSDIKKVNEIFRELEDAYAEDREKRKGRLPTAAELIRLVDGKGTARALWKLKRKWAEDFYGVMQRARKAQKAASEALGFVPDDYPEHRQKAHDDFMLEIELLRQEPNADGIAIHSGESPEEMKEADSISGYVLRHWHDGKMVSERLTSTERKIIAYCQDKPLVNQRSGFYFSSICADLEVGGKCSKAHAPANLFWKDRVREKKGRFRIFPLVFKPKHGAERGLYEYIGPPGTLSRTSRT